MFYNPVPNQIPEIEVAQTPDVLQPGPQEGSKTGVADAAQVSRVHPEVAHFSFNALSQTKFQTEVGSNLPMVCNLVPNQVPKQS